MATLSEIINTTVKIPEYVVEVGVFEAKTTRRVLLGVTNAQLMFIHENGSPLNNIPARPVLQMTIDWATSSGLVEKTLDSMFEIYLRTESEEAVNREVKKFCLKLQNYARQIIYENKLLERNAPSTIRSKGFDHPLFKTGQLARSITCRPLKVTKGGYVEI